MAIGSDACSTSSDPYDHVDAFVVLDGDAVTPTSFELTAEVDRVDVLFSIDTSGSMDSELGKIKDHLAGSVVRDIRHFVSDAAFGVSAFRDFPFHPFGGSTDYPFHLAQRVTTDATAIQGAADSLTISGSGDTLESGFEALYQIAVGDGGVTWSGGGIGAFDPTVGLIAGVADGPIGGVGFREGSLPIVVHVTDAVSHDAADYGSSVSGAHTRSEAVAGLQGISARFTGVTSGAAARTELVGLAEESNGTVPVCAFESSCGVDQCCTGQTGTAEPPVSGVCPLVFSVSQEGTGMMYGMIYGVYVLVEHTRLLVSQEVIPDPSVLPSVDTSCFVESVEAKQWTRSGSCGPDPVADGDHFDDVSHGTDLVFDLQLRNDGCAAALDTPQLYSTTIRAWGDGVLLLDTLELYIVVRPTP
ncbi:MAG: hypothetical protein JRI25_25475 [Deltaproteobacteria bacterium]|nr:hypothetical protein [Deltaproteobacteria bacterium]